MRSLSLPGAVLGMLFLFSGICLAGDKPKPTLPIVAENAAPISWDGVIHAGAIQASDDPLGNAARGDQVCYKMRSYLVQREAAGSDTVRPVGYRTCLPGSRIEMRTTDRRDDTTPLAK